MSIFQTYLTGLVVIHLAWFYFFSTGQLVRPRNKDEQSFFPLADLVVTSVAGMALVGFALVFLGFAHLLNPFGIFFGLVLEGLLFWWLRSDNWFSWIFWQRTFQKLLKGWTAPACFIYLILLFLSLPAVLPPAMADAVNYHLAYALDWANAGRIHVDPFLRFPFYANNFLLFYSAFFVLNLGRYCQFLNWLCGLLTCLGVLAFFAPAVTQRTSQHSALKRFQPEQFLIPLCVALSPIFLRYLNIAILDVPIGLFLLASVLCVYRSSMFQSFERQLVATGSFCAGMKLTMIGHLPFFIASLFFIRAHRMPRRKIALLCVLLVGLSLPWYFRNLVETHDPTPPIFNFYFKHPDPIYSQADANIYMHDVTPVHNAASLLLVPLRFFTNTESTEFLERGSNALVILLYAPAVFLIAQLFRRRRRADHRLIYLSATVTYLAAPWFVSSAGRHSLHWYPLLAAWAGVIISKLRAQADGLFNSSLGILTNRVATAALSCALICPTLTRSCMEFYGTYYADTIPLSRPRAQLNAYLKKYVRGYNEGRAVIETLSLNHRKDRILVFGRETPAYYFRKARMLSVGDYYGPARYADLIAEVRQGDCRPYLEHFRISAIIVDPRIANGARLLYGKFEKELEQDRFLEYRCEEGKVPVFLKSDLTPSARLTRVIHRSWPSVPQTHRLSPQVHA